MNWVDRIRTQFQLETATETWKNNKALDGTILADSNKRYSAWVSSFKELSDLPVEYLLPRIRVTYRDCLTGPMQSAEERFKRHPQVAERLAKMQWGYYFNLGGGLSTADATPFFRPRIRAQTLLRMQMINDVIECVISPEIGDATLLDFACNWGGFAIDMALRGLKQATAFDFKKDNIERAKLLAEYMGVQNLSFEVQNVYSLPDSYMNGFDVVYNLGLIYHVTDPVKLVLLTYQLTKQIAVFDTIAHREPFSGFILGHLSESNLSRPGMGEQHVELHPTYRGLIDLIHFAGFRDLVEVVPTIGSEFPHREQDVYFQSLRRTIIAFK
jgi:2-polyprenyl-3-methyl-5-hydroxy-6-metoxy-1,4-benzoquinol methylase